MNENIADEIRKTIESIKDMKTQVGGINNYLSILEGLLRTDIQKKVEDAYQRGLEEGKKATFGLVADASNAEYQRGLEDAWECARKLFSSMADSDIEKAFPTEWNNGGFKALINLQPQEAIAKLKAYEKKQSDKIKVGDEVQHGDSTGIVYVIGDLILSGLCTGDESFVPFQWYKEECKKTGRRFETNFRQINEEETR